MYADLAAFFARPPEVVAPELLGALLSHAGVTVRLTEVEAYGGPDDAGSHAYRGQTERNAAMFGPPGRLYVYFTYGMHHCANLVCDRSGVPGAVLLRAGEVVEGVSEARVRRSNGRKRISALRDFELARGPANLAVCLSLTRVDDKTQIVAAFSGSNSDAHKPQLTLSGADPASVGSNPRAVIASGPRVGLRYAADKPWRFWLEGEPSVSSYRPAPARPRASLNPAR